jgi:hypothetical protein
MSGDALHRTVLNLDTPQIDNDERGFFGYLCRKSPCFVNERGRPRFFPGRFPERSLS